MSESRYCALCDEPTREWHTGYEDGDVCPVCGAVLYESKDHYVDVMIGFLDDKAGYSEEETRTFLLEHGNPGKGQALAILEQHGK